MKHEYKPGDRVEVVGPDAEGNEYVQASTGVCDDPEPVYVRVGLDGYGLAARFPLSSLRPLRSSALAPGVRVRVKETGEEGKICVVWKATDGVFDVAGLSSRYELLKNQQLFGADELEVVPAPEPKRAPRPGEVWATEMGTALVIARYGFVFNLVRLTSYRIPEGNMADSLERGTFTFLAPDLQTYFWSLP